MNLKSNMLKFLVVFALILMIIPAIAAEDTAQDDGAVSESDDVVLSESGADDSSETLEVTEDNLEVEPEDLAETQEGYAAGEPNIVADARLRDSKSADLAVEVYPAYQDAKAGDIVMWAVSFANYGPDMAEDTIGYVQLIEGHMYLLDVFATYYNPLYFDEPITIPEETLAEMFDPVTGVFNIGDMYPYDFIDLYLVALAADDTEAILFASIASHTSDPNLENNVDMGFVNYAGEAAAAEETLPAAGNPIAMALLALISIVGVTFGRRL